MGQPIRARSTCRRRQDTDNEADETFTVTLSGVSTNATLAADPTATGTINNRATGGGRADGFRGRRVGNAQVDAVVGHAGPRA